jgi:hypothetical protein
MSNNGRIYALLLVMELGIFTPSCSALPATSHAEVSKKNAPVGNYTQSKVQARCSSNHYGSNDSLCAEWKSADAARDAIKWTAVGTIISAISLLLVLYALSLTIRSNSIAQDTAKRQLRAYFHVTSVIICDFRVIPFSANFLCHNRGTTPANGIVQSLGWQITFNDLPDVIEFPVQVIRSSNAPVAPGMHYVSRFQLPEVTRWIQPGQLNPIVDKLLNGSGRMRIFGSFTYCDTFGEEHITEYNLFFGGEAGLLFTVMEGQSGEVISMAFETDGNRAN